VDHLPPIVAVHVEENGVTFPQNQPRLERVAINVPHLNRWIELFEALLGPAFERTTIQQAHGPVEIAIHPAGIELVLSDVERPSLRSFHLATQDPTLMANIAHGLGWHTVDKVTLRGRRHEVLDANGLRLLIVDISSDADNGSGAD